MALRKSSAVTRKKVNFDDVLNEDITLAIITKAQRINIYDKRKIYLREKFFIEVSANFVIFDGLQDSLMN